MQIAYAANFLSTLMNCWNWIDTILGRCKLNLAVLPAPLAWLGWAPLALLATLILWAAAKIPPVKSALSLLLRPRMVLAISWLAVSIVWTSNICYFSHGPLDGHTYWWLSDDAMISMRYARNLATGHGLVWNHHEHVEGYTNFAWVLYMAFVHLLNPHDASSSLVILLTTIILAMAVIPYLIRLVRLLGGSDLAAAAAAAGFALNGNALVHAYNGLETMLFTLLLTLLCCRLIEEHGRQPRLATYFGLGALPLVRADAWFWTGALLALAFLSARPRRPLVRFAAAGLILPFLHELFRIVYYGDLLPNTAYLKVAGWNAAVHGLAYVEHYALQYYALIAVAILGACVPRSKWQRHLAVIYCLFGGFVIYIGGDNFDFFRFFVPVLPLLLSLAFTALASLLPRPAPRLLVILLCLVSTPLLLIEYKPVHDYLDYWRHYDARMLKMGLLLKKNTQPQSKVAATAAGLLFYFSDRPGVDLLGKCDRHIAHLPARQESSLPGHNKFDFDYSLGVLRPDLVVAEFPQGASPKFMLTRMTGDMAYSGQFFFNQIFRKKYLLWPINLPTLYPIYVAEWSPEQNNRKKWQDLQ